MLEKQVQVVKVNTMADKTVRLTIDLLNATSDDIKAAFEFMEVDTTMVLANTNQMVEAKGEVKNLS
ncbi:MAG: hypothetical protein ACOC3V_01875 [bacterium]